MTRWLPFPVFSLCLLALWLVLNATLAPEHILLGGVLGVAGSMVFGRLQAPTARVRLRPWTVATLSWLMLVDIVRSNVAVVRFAFRPGLPQRSGFVDIPIELRDPHGLAVLAAIVTSTPGTAWAGLSEDGSVLRLHVLDVAEEDELVRTVQERYEQPLRRIFEP